MFENKIRINIYAPNLPKKELIGVLYIQLNEPTENVFIKELPKQSGFRAAEMIISINREEVLYHKVINELFSVAHKLGGTKSVIVNETNKNFEIWLNNNKDYSGISFPKNFENVKIEIY